VDKIVPYTLTLNIPLEAQDNLDTEAMATMLGYIINDRLYCNHPDFFSQMFSHALIAQLKRAFRDVVEKACQKIFRHKIVTSHDGRGSAAKWLIEADKRLEKLSCPYISSGRTGVTITKGMPQ